MPSKESGMPFQRGLRLWILGSFAATAACVGVGIASDYGHHESVQTAVPPRSGHPASQNRETPTITRAGPIDHHATTSESHEDNGVPLGLAVGVISVGAACLLEAARYNMRLKDSRPSEAEHAPVDQGLYDDVFEEMRRRYDEG